ncbi:lytic transglycosylase domain-containing protein [Crenothrix polyspora]|uniref:Soluble lytic murein transglycosylase Slt n=1 Tax=Crenothrix polyspora TaxID=360316 RepID=A0A1R4HEJ2_9GAMM|nr:lytic transglycosylase domain-containing protein [Crenothrix polyspora]SJM94451.1 Soluble lytic murein transglycosylase Slt [Crenothrix polyspora]
MRLKIAAVILLISCGVFFWYQASSLPSLAQQREYFADAEKLLGKDQEKDYLRLTKKLAGYPLYPYLQAKWLTNRLSQTAAITDFLAAHKDSHYADTLRTSWLNRLVEQKRWPEFIKYYQPSDDKNLSCQYQWARYQSGEQAQALEATQTMWASLATYPESCTVLFTALTRSGQLKPEVIWQRFEAALTQNNLATANATLGLLSQDEQLIAKQWLHIHQTPDSIKNTAFLKNKDSLSGRLFSYGIDKLAKPNIELALNLWDSQNKSFNLDETTRQRIEHRLALILAVRRDHRVFERLARVTQPNEELKMWSIRSALFTQNWPQVIKAFGSFSAKQQQDPHWQYWYARALGETGDTAKAQATYAMVANDRSFHGFLAADRLDLPYQLNDKPIVINDEALAALRQGTELKVVEEFIALKRETDARRLWPILIKKLSKEQLLLAAKLAQGWHWQQTAIITLTKADYWDDLDLRFPTDYKAQIESNAALQNLDPALIFGLMRQESMMDKMAASPVGAKGLMQLMPGTGEQIAKTLGDSWHSDQDLFNPELNIKYGSYYFKELLKQFNGHAALATASYNAGPARVKKWLPQGKALPVDLWVETIPYKETRKYVSTVLSYAIIYQHRLQRNSLKLKNILPDVPAAKN